MIKPTTIRLPETLDTELEIRNAIKTAAIAESLDRYYSLLDRALWKLRREGVFCQSELNLMADCCNGTIFDAWSVPLLLANIEDGIAMGGLAHKWNVDGPSLIDKLKTLDLASTFALVDAIERFWLATAQGKPVALDDLLK